jgi:hypothetical protein
MDLTEYYGPIGSLMGLKINILEEIFIFFSVPNFYIQSIVYQIALSEHVNWSKTIKYKNIIFILSYEK